MTPPATQQWKQLTFALCVQVDPKRNAAHLVKDLLLMHTEIRAINGKIWEHDKITVWYQMLVLVAA